MTIVEKEAFWIAGIRVEASFQELWEKMPQKWYEMFEKYPEVSHRKTDILMDISLGKKNNIYTQFIAVEITVPSAKIPEDMQKMEIPAKKYLYHQHTGSLKGIATTFGEMHNYAQKNGLELTDFKLDIGYTPDGNESHHGLYIEITK